MSSDTPPYRGPGPNHGVFIRGSRPSYPPGWGVAAPQNFPYIRIKCWDCSGKKTGHQKHPDQIWLEVESSTNHPDPKKTHTNQKTYRNSRTLPLPKPTPPPTFNLYPRPFRPLGCAPEALKSNENGYGCETQGPCPHLIGVCISIKHMPAYRALSQTSFLRLCSLYKVIFEDFGYGKKTQIPTYSEHERGKPFGQHWANRSRPV